MTSAAVVQVRGVHKTYRRWREPPEHAVRGLDLTVEAGGVFGFLGPNGLGKTTTIRLLLRAGEARSGSLRLFGRPVLDELPLAHASSIPAARVQQMLELVDLAGRPRRGPGEGYLLGMKHRLGIAAAALLKNPELLILDEPGNGLDAAGIREVRELILRLGAPV